jgi:hypothetical protein
MKPTSKISKLKFICFLVLGLLYFVLTKYIGSQAIPFMLFIGVLIICTAEWIKTKKITLSYISLPAVTIAFLINAFVQLFGKLSMEEILFALNLGNKYDLTIRATWFSIWLFHCFWGYFYGFDLSSEGQRENGTRLSPLQKIQLITQHYTRILLPFIIFPTICSVVKQILYL